MPLEDSADPSPSSRRPATWARVLLTALLGAFVIFAATSTYDYHAFLMAGFFAFALLGVTVLHLSVRRSARDIAGIAVFVAAATAVDVELLGYPARLPATLSFIGLGSLLVLGLRLIWEDTYDPLLNRAFWPALLFTATAAGSSRALDLTSQLHQRTYDLYLYSFDCTLGFQASYAAAALFLQVHALGTASTLAYILLPLLLALICAASLKRPQALWITALAFVLSAPIGVAAFNVLPATGPVRTFPNFPQLPIETAKVARLFLETVPVPGPRNAIPSLHMTWAILAWWNSRGTPRWIRALALLGLILTVLSTLGTGEHYLVDLVVAYPFSLAIQAIATALVAKRNWQIPLLAGAAMSAAWFAILRYGVPLMWKARPLSWILTLATVGVSGYLAHRLLKSFQEQDAAAATG